MNQAMVDLVGKGGGQGEVAQKLHGSQLNIGAMRPYVGEDGGVYMTVYNGGPADKASSYEQVQVNAKGTLRRDEWIRLDEAVLRIAEDRLTGFQYFIDRGLTYNLGNAMGTTVLEYHDVGDALEAELSMDAVTRGQGDRQEYNSVYLPIPIIHADYEINQRALEASRNLGNPISTDMAERATRKVLEKRESLLFTDTSYGYGGGTIYSLLNFPDRLQKGSLSDWSSNAVAGADIVDEVLEMKQLSIDNNFYGPWVLLIPTNFETKMDEDYSDQKGDNTIRDRVENIRGIDDVQVVDTLPDDNVVLVQLTTDVIRIVQGMGIQNVQWETQGGFVNKFKTMTIQVPQIRSDQEGKTGIVHGTVAAT